MDNVAKSIYNLIFTNDGNFKSDKQKSFFLKMQNDCRGAILLDSGQVYKNSYMIFAQVDNLGVVSITKDTSKKTTVLYTRENHNQYIAKHEVKQQQRKQHAEKMKALQAEYDARNAKRAKIQKIIDKYNFTCEYITDVVYDAVMNNKQLEIKESILSVGAKVDKLKALLDAI